MLLPVPVQSLVELGLQKLRVTETKSSFGINVHGVTLGLSVSGSLTFGAGKRYSNFANCPMLLR